MNKEQRAALKARADELKTSKAATVAGPAVVQTVEAPAVPRKRGQYRPGASRQRTTPRSSRSPAATRSASVISKGSGAQGCRNVARRKRKERTGGRLPHGATYVKVYDAERQLWTGTLSIPGEAPLTARASGSFGTEVLLDGQYRERLSTAPAAPG